MLTIVKSDILEIFEIYKEGRKNYFFKLFLSIGFERATNGEHIPGEKFFLDPFGAQGSHPKTGLSNIGKTHLCS
jgi:hypothetical protein